MSAEVYLGCEKCKSAYHIGYIVTIRSNFVLHKQPRMLQGLEQFIDKHSYCGDALNFPRIIWEGSFGDEWERVEWPAPQAGGDL